ncbi:MAG: hypothetical protein H6574_14825 [Lewinellaceae bacterium]|nr:hypothetical protein [Saprospiraceae bacterium]MCB9315233.1 hypothetical protein [Lewinellaceae bacterium]MCB9332353.1 hypothetical protein [Lewinellaceae bacterium]
MIRYFQIIIWTCISLFAFGQAPFYVSYPASLETGPLDGRLLLLISTDSSAEPRFQITDEFSTAQVFGLNVDAWAPGQPARFAGVEYGYPIQYLRDLPAGEYYVQAVLHRYETFQRKDGHTVKMPMDRGEGQQWNRAPGNLYSTVQKIQYNPLLKGIYRIDLSQKIPPIEEPKDTRYIKHIKIQSKLLTEFWGRPMYLGAHVLLPEGFDEHPEARYPLAVFHGHFPADFGGFRTEPPDPNLAPAYSKRFRLEGYNRIQQQEAYDFYKIWTGPDFPRVLAVEIQHPCPFYDDSYAVNSVNVGPYGDAIMYELIPEIERRFRGIGAGWARLTYGGSTGGWEALAVQVFYPELFSGCYAACPDPVDFRAYMSVNIYENKNAYYQEGPFDKIARPSRRDYLGHISSTVKSSAQMEYALGDRHRSGGQFDIWEAVYGPLGPDGYPAPLWDRRTGEIDHQVAEYWRENYDLAYILKRDWNELGPKLQGKIHVYCGDMDNYYLNNGVYLLEEILNTLDAPPYDGQVDYGDRAEHCWNGDHTQPNAISRLRYHRYFIPKWTEEIQKRAPEGADLKSWRY